MVERSLGARRLRSSVVAGTIGERRVYTYADCFARAGSFEFHYNRCHRAHHLLIFNIPRTVYEAKKTIARAAETVKCILRPTDTYGYRHPVGRIGEDGCYDPLSFLHHLDVVAIVHGSTQRYSASTGPRLSPRLVRASENCSESMSVTRTRDADDFVTGSYDGSVSF